MPPEAPSRKEKTNRIGLTVQEYEGHKSTLCLGCGHDSISTRITRSFFELGIDPARVVKLSGIGCSSKTPAYFLKSAHGFNAVHGRMPSVATGVHLANRSLLPLGVSGDGDTANIGLGQFCHMIRRNVRCIYIVENNGVYGLTKGQFSATADRGSVAKGGGVNEDSSIDLCGLALELGASFVARSFSGDVKQLTALIKAATAHNGMALLDVISPCVTFNNHEGSTKSYSWAKEHDIPLHEIGYVPTFEQIQVDFEPGTVQQVTLHDGSVVTLKKLESDFDPTDRKQAYDAIDRSRRENVLLTGLLYVDPDRKGFIELLRTVDEPLASLPQEKLRPPKEVLDRLMQEYV